MMRMLKIKCGAVSVIDVTLSLSLFYSQVEGAKKFGGPLLSAATSSCVEGVHHGPVRSDEVSTSSDHFPAQKSVSKWYPARSNDHL